MRKVKMLAAAVAILAVGGIASASAQAAGTATVTLVGTGSCDVSYASSAWAGSPSSSNISSIVVAPGGTCDVDTVTGSGTLERTVPGTAATFAGAFHIETFFGIIECEYEGELDGTWATSGTKYSFDLAGTAALTNDGDFCPEEPEIEMTGLVDQ